MSKVDGMVEDGFETIREAFAQAQVQDEGGAQLCIYRHGKRVVDLWTGRDKVKDRPYTADTISIIMSCGKGVTATCAQEAGFAVQEILPRYKGVQFLLASPKPPSGR